MNRLTTDRLTVSSVIIVPLAALALTWSITGYACNEYSLLDCDTQDHFDDVYDRQERNREREMQQYRMDQFEREMENDRWEADRERARQEQDRQWNNRDTGKGTSDVICHYLDSDC